MRLPKHVAAQETLLDEVMLTLKSPQRILFDIGMMR